MTHEEFETIAALSAVGAAAPDEMRALDDHVAACGPCRTARDEYAEAATLMARDLDPVVPPATLRRSILASAGDDDSTGSRGNVWWLATAATMFLALWGWREIGIRVLREKVSSQQAEIRQLSDANHTLGDQREKLSGAMAAILGGATQTISLSGQQIAPSSSARVFVDAPNRRAVVVFSNLPQNPGDKSYQLWLIRADQPAPQSAGVFDVEKGNAAITIDNLPVATEIKGLAVTLEKHGGSPQPTSANYYVLGNT